MPYSAADLRLDRMRELLDRLGRPDRDLPVVHVAGTKGKGSTAAMVAAVLTSAGYRCGLFTSPHLHGVEERFSVDGHAMPAQELVSLLEQMRPAVEEMDRQAAVRGELGPTFFELTTALAWLHFRGAGAQIAVLEVGLGGRLDSTNVCEPLVAVVTSISLDHTRQLGYTLTAIAREKAGIVKPGVPVVSGVTGPEPRTVIREVAGEMGCRLQELGQDFDFEYSPPRHLEQSPSAGSFVFRPLTGAVPPPSASVSAPAPATLPCESFKTRSDPLRLTEPLPLALPGRHQAANATVALAVIQELVRLGWSINESDIGRALGNMSWPARVEVLSRRPAVIVDAAHNVASAAALIETLRESFEVGRRYLVFGAAADKDIPGMLRVLMPHFERSYFTRSASNPRAAAAEEILSAAQEVSDRPCSVFQSPADAFRAACAAATVEDLICVTGSFYLAAEVRAIVADAPRQA